MSGYQLIEKSKASDLFWSLYDKLTKQLSYLSSLHSFESLSYYEQNQLDRTNFINDISFIVVHDGRPILCFFGVIYQEKNVNIISAYEIPSFILEINCLSRSQKKECIKFILKKLPIDCPSILLLRDDMLSGHIGQSLDSLLINNFKSNHELHYTRAIDLHQDEATLKKNLRKSYGPLIKRSLEQFSVTIYNSENINWPAFEEFRQLHIQESGRETRSISSWKKQYEAISAGKAFFITAKESERLLSAGFFCISLQHCYYASSASVRDLFAKPLSHSVIWTAILYAKSLGISIFETGEQYVLSDSREQLTMKETSIALFKSGFGGNLKPYIIYKVFIN